MKKSNFSLCYLLVSFVLNYQSTTLIDNLLRQREENMVRSSRAALFIELGIGNEFSVTNKVAASPSFEIQLVTALGEYGVEERFEATEVAHFV